MVYKHVYNHLGLNTREINISTNIVSCYMTHTSPYYRNLRTSYNLPLTLENDFIGYIHTLSGEGTIHLADGDVVFHANDAMFFHHQQNKGFTNENSNWEFVVVYFRISNLSIPLNVKWNFSPLSGEIDTFKEMHYLINSNNYLNVCKANTLLQGLIIDVLAYTGTTAENTPYDESMQFIEKYIHQNINENLQVKDLAALCSFSNNHFCNIFKQHFKISPKNYIIKEKLKKAAFLLNDTTLSIANISEELSFYSPAYFTSCFKKYYKATPSEFRAKKR
ncbi:MAG: helix-turn-helix transcriptional regulator [Clostridia bacterium]|nr:helix-turn-helix transcriptional regulator [Clostridia bacterium]